MFPGSIGGWPRIERCGAAEALPGPAFERGLESAVEFVFHPLPPLGDHQGDISVLAVAVFPRFEDASDFENRERGKMVAVADDGAQQARHKPAAQTV